MYVLPVSAECVEGHLRMHGFSSGLPSPVSLHVDLPSCEIREGNALGRTVSQVPFGSGELGRGGAYTECVLSTFCVSSTCGQQGAESGYVRAYVPCIRVHMYVCICVCVRMNSCSGWAWEWVTYHGQTMLLMLICFKIVCFCNLGTNVCSMYTVRPVGHLIRSTPILGTGICE